MCEAYNSTPQSLTCFVLKTMPVAVVHRARSRRFSAGKHSSSIASRIHHSSVSDSLRRDCCVVDLDFHSRRHFECRWSDSRSLVGCAAGSLSNVLADTATLAPPQWQWMSISHSHWMSSMIHFGQVIMMSYDCILNGKWVSWDMYLLYLKGLARGYL